MLLSGRALNSHRPKTPFIRMEMLVRALRNYDLLLTCVNEDRVHIDFGTERAQNKSAGWSKYQHREQDS